MGVLDNDKNWGYRCGSLVGRIYPQNRIAAVCCCFASSERPALSVVRSEHRVPISGEDRQPAPNPASDTETARATKEQTARASVPRYLDVDARDRSGQPALCPSAVASLPHSRKFSCPRVVAWPKAGSWGFGNLKIPHREKNELPWAASGTVAAEGGGGAPKKRKEKSKT